MATARRLSLMFVVAVLVASICFAAVAQGGVVGYTVRDTELQEWPGTAPWTINIVRSGTGLYVLCRIPVQDNWWLNVYVPNLSTKIGFVADDDTVCDDGVKCSTLVESCGGSYQM